MAYPASTVARAGGLRLRHWPRPVPPALIRPTNFRQAQRLDQLALLGAGLLPRERDAGCDRAAGDEPENAAGCIAHVEPANARRQRICSTRRHIVQPLRMGESA